MLAFGGKPVGIEARDDAGGGRRRAELWIEDDRGRHRYRPAARSNGLQGKAGDWSVYLEMLPAGDGFDRLRVTVEPAGAGRLKRIWVRIAGGQGAVPTLNTSRTRMLLLPEEVFVEKGVVTLGRGRGEAVSRFLTVLHRGPRNLLAGVGDISPDFSFFRVDGEALEAGFELDRVLSRPERYDLVFGTGDDPLELLDGYGRLLAPLGRAGRARVTGWNSWDYYGAAVSMDDLRQEMAAIHASPLRGRLSHLVIDMGWWTDWGETATNRRFPSSFRAIAREIEAAGFVPGIWHAPLLCSPWTALGRHRQDLFIPDETGNAATVNANAILDWSKPEVLDLLYRWFQQLRKAGFRYFKLDYIYSDAIRKMTRRADGTVGPLAAIRRGLQAIREAVGEESYVLNCGAPRECALGLADASRISTDIHTFWSHIWHNSREIACHLWEQGNLWNIDPDFALARSPETSRDPFPNYIYRRRAWTSPDHFWMAGPEAARAELQTWLTVVHMCGGDVFLSDSIARLNRRGLAMLNKPFPPLTTAARALDLFESDWPRFWLGRTGERERLAIFNWADEEAPITVPDGIDVPSCGRDLWSGSRVTVDERTVMAPHSAYLLEV